MFSFIATAFSDAESGHQSTVINAIILEKMRRYILAMKFWIDYITSRSNELPLILEA